MQRTHSSVDSLASITKAEDVGTVASLLRRYPSLAQDILLYSNLFGRN